MIGRMDLGRTGSVRVYFQDSWNDAELEYVGVVVLDRRLNAVAGTEDESLNSPEMLQTFLSRWAVDPVWDAQGTPLLTADNLTNPSAIIPYTCPLGSVDYSMVKVALYLPDYDPAAELWFAEIGLRGTTGLRWAWLTLVRYKPDITNGFAFSEGIRLGPTQLLSNPEH